MKLPCVYIVANKKNGTLYVGVTSDPVRRAYQHRNHLIKGFASRYGCKYLVWYELHEDMAAAIQREKQIKGGNRAKKIILIETMNPAWIDLFDSLL